jgi:hypothetical protein
MAVAQPQLDQIIDLIKTVLAGIMGADAKTGPFKILKEGAALGGVLKEAREKFQGNAVMEQLLGALLSKDEEGDNTPEAEAPADGPKLGQTSIDDVLGKLGGLRGILDMIPGGNDIKQFIYDLAEKVAGAAGSGLFGSGPKVSQNESNFLSALKNGLGI